MKLFNLFIGAVLLLLIPKQQFAQNIFYYEPDTNHHYYPSDIIATQNGELVVMADVSYRGYLLHNYFFDRYLLRIKTNGDEVWGQSHADTKGQGMLLEQATGSFIALSNIDGAYSCGFIGQTYPYTDYSVNSYGSTGSLATSNSYDEACENRLSNFKKRDDGGVLAVQTAIINSNYQYSIKELAPNGQLTSLNFPAAIRGGGLVEKNATGYWVMQYDSLYRLDLTGNLLWKDTIINYPYISKFIKVGQDSLLVVSSATHVSASDLTYLSKYNNLGEKDWTRTFAMETSHVLWHSSGNYLLTGTRNDQLSLLLVSPDGDSLWSTTHIMADPSAAVKTIEVGNNKIATLGRESAAFTMLSGRVIVIMDSIVINPTINSINKIAAPLSAHCYPNPSNGQVTIAIQEAGEQAYEVTIISLLGRAVLSKSFSEPQFSMDMEQLPTGVYMVNVTSSTGAVFREKLVLKK